MMNSTGKGKNSGMMESSRALIIMGLGMVKASLSCKQIHLVSKGVWVKSNFLG